jgi:hypothetical protein
MQRKELKDIQDSGFKVPKSYFENFDNNMLTHASLNDKVSDSGFSIPEGYFDTLEEKILNSLPEKEPVKVISLKNRKSIIYVTSIAAALVLMFNLFESKSESDINSIETASIERYLSDEDFGSEELASLFNDADFNDDSFNTMRFSEEAVEDYVNDNLDLNDLYIE